MLFDFITSGKEKRSLRIFLGIRVRVTTRLHRPREAHVSQEHWILNHLTALTAGQESLFRYARHDKSAGFYPNNIPQKKKRILQYQSQAPVPVKSGKGVNEVRLELSCLSDDCFTTIRYRTR